jgi:hypothetical protein
MLRTTEAQVRNLVQGIVCPTRVIHADPAQPYLPEKLRSRARRAVAAGRVARAARRTPPAHGGPAGRAEVIGDFFRGGR